MADPSPWSFSLTREDILARRAKRAEIAAELEALQKRLDEEDRWFDAVKLIVPHSLFAGLDEPSNSTQDGSEKASVWRQAISAALGEATHGLLPREIAVLIKERGSLEANERLIRNPNGLYTALSRMLSEGQVFKHGDKFYRRGLYEELIDKGELDEDADDRNITGVNGFILSLFGDWVKMSPKEIIAKLREHEEYSERIENNPQYGYSAIARLVRQGHLEKIGSDYTRPLKRNEPSNAGALGGSLAGSKEGHFS